MKKLLFIIAIFLCSCNQNSVNQNPGNSNMSINMSMDQFKTSLIEYSKNNPYPNIDE